ncbi:MAG: lipopolysaccharide assembly protein LapB [Burkholderiales bacterium]
MEFEFWWLLAFPLFFGLGWLAARIDIKQLLTESRALPKSYFKGLNALLDEQPDKAIEAFIEVVKVDPQTIELHFALGNLFRRRGETDRAIRMHQNLLDRADLSQEQKYKVISELAQDYLKAGLLDRAEELFRRLIGTPHSEQAMNALLEVYEQEKEWVSAIDVARDLARSSGQPRDKQIAHYYCERAAQEIVHSQFDAALHHLNDALAIDKKNVRANILMGDLHVSRNDHPAALDVWKQIETQNANYLPLIAEKIAESYTTLNRSEEGLALLRGYLMNYPSLDLLNVVFQATLEQHGPEQANRLVREQLRRNPTLLGLDKLLEAQILESPPERRRDLELIKNLVHQHTRSLALYRCDQCGFKARQFYWRCLACGGWETYPPRRTEERMLPA